MHRDEHWLVRDLALQGEGVRFGADGTRCLGEFSTNLNANPSFNPTLSLSLSLSLKPHPNQASSASGRQMAGGRWSTRRRARCAGCSQARRATRTMRTS